MGGNEEVGKTVGSRCGTQWGGWEDCRSAKHEHVTCAGDDAAMNEGKQSLLGDVTGSRCLGEECGKIMLDVCCVRT